MVQAGYDKPFATAVISVASGLAIIIPPSITFILYAVITGVSVGAIFAAGFLPGFVIAAFLMISAWFTSRKKAIVERLVLMASRVFLSRGERRSGRS